ncbi:MAG TPA: hypothetical protein VJU61_04710 [Polyangiaceae bacterium]|nr:hypothetical protein [Polyangiaceae bacterium]
MDEELRRWANTWKSMEVQNMKVMERSQAAHRKEATTHAVMATALGACALMMAAKAVRDFSVGAVPVQGLPLAVGAGALLLGAVVLGRAGWQSRDARANLSDTPLGLVVDLVRLRERELHAWLGKWSLGTTAVLAVAAIALAVYRVQEARSAAEPSALAWGSLVFSVVGVIVVALTGRKRVAYLRRDIASLHELRRQLASHDPQPS